MAFYTRLREKKLADKFFRVFVAKLQLAQSRLKNDMMNGSVGRNKSGKQAVDRVHADC